ncbi:MAG: nickel pincer cofactor biosynthesis protein LarC [Candidatus Latescibacterota bacterium]|nr:nickel pincer cofactor biosynthesis protein LarC [Candidatus Latescibacterota bacterium]
MLVAYFDCFSGISGDMLLGALVDAGLDAAVLRAEIARLEADAKIEVSRVERCGLAATRVQVVIGGEPVSFEDEHHLHNHANRSGHIHLRQIVAHLDSSDLYPQDRERTEAVFRRLTAAEAAVHGRELDSVGLHEVGTLDAIVDVAGTISGLRILGVERVYSSALHCGTGLVRCAHGKYPVPVPGVLALCEGVPLVQTETPVELITPTGAAIITELAHGFGAAPAMTLHAVGYGAGSHDNEETPNVLRVRIGELVETARTDGETIRVLEANIDDMNPEVFSYLFEELLRAGARDVFLTPMQMKKGRPGNQLTVLCVPEEAQRLGDIVLHETTTLGIRFHDTTRRTLQRSERSVETPFGAVRVKVAHLDTSSARHAPEYEDCAARARERGVPLLRVYDAALHAIEQEDQACDG